VIKTDRTHCVRDAGGDVLVVDDFPDALALYEALLTEDGHRVRTASNGLDALQQVEQSEPEVVLLDVSMPGLDGVEVLRRLRARSHGGPAVMMITAARREPDAIEAGLREGADAYLTKPIDARELVARVRAALVKFRLERLLDTQRRDHIAMLVHDLRHPLSSLALIAEVLESEDMTPETRSAVIEQIRGMVSEMTRLIDGMLVATRLEAGIFTVEPRLGSLSDIIEPTLRMFTPVAARRQVDLRVERPADDRVRADSPKLRQALDNIVANALKFTPKGGCVRLRVWHEPPGLTELPGQLIFEIADTGPGIPAGERTTIFDRYRQGSKGRAAGGAGLGLAIARGIAKAHGGDVSVGSSDLGGAAFRLTIPSSTGPRQARA
jgi:signal transduction histidine kinase